MILPPGRFLNLWEMVREVLPHATLKSVDAALWATGA